MHRTAGATVHVQNRFACIVSVRNFSRRLGDAGSVRQGFGSFHSEDIEALVNTPQLRPPSVMQTLLTSSRMKWELCKSLSFGAECREHLFGLDPSWTFLNHGAFGGAMQPQMDAAEYIRRHCETQPLRFYDRELFPLMAYSLQKAACHFHCPANELYPLQNVTTGLNCILQSIHLSSGDEVVHLSLTYGSTKKMLQDVCLRSGASLKVVQLPLPIENEQSILEKFAGALSGRTKLVILDQITSNTALVLPTLAMARLAKQAGALVVVDAAHAMMSTDIRIYPRHLAIPGPALPAAAAAAAAVESAPLHARKKNLSGSCSQAELDKTCPEDTLSDVADVWLTNAHKWFCAPKGCAFMWVRSEVAMHLRPPVVSHGFQVRECMVVAADRQARWWYERKESFGDFRRAVDVGRQEDKTERGRLLSALAWDGCRDYAALLSVPVGLQIWSFLSGRTDATSPSALSENRDEFASGAAQEGMARSRAYMQNLLHDEVVPTLMQEWGLCERDFAGPASMRTGSPMVLVPLPRMLLGLDTTKNTTDKHAFALQEILHHEHKIEVPAKCLEGRLYLRVSAHIHNTLDQYERLADTIKKLE